MAPPCKYNMTWQIILYALIIAGAVLLFLSMFSQIDAYNDMPELTEELRIEKIADGTLADYFDAADAIKKGLFAPGDEGLFVTGAVLAITGSVGEVWRSYKTQGDSWTIALKAISVVMIILAFTWNSQTSPIERVVFLGFCLGMFVVSDLCYHFHVKGKNALKFDEKAKHTRLAQEKKNEIIAKTSKEDVATMKDVARMKHDRQNLMLARLLDAINEASMENTDKLKGAGRSANQEARPHHIMMSRKPSEVPRGCTEVNKI